MVKKLLLFHPIHLSELSKTTVNNQKIFQFFSTLFFITEKPEFGRTTDLYEMKARSIFFMLYQGGLRPNSKILTIP